MYTNKQGVKGDRGASAANAVLPNGKQSDAAVDTAESTIAVVAVVIAAVALVGNVVLVVCVLKIKKKASHP